MSMRNTAIVERSKVKLTRARVKHASLNSVSPTLYMYLWRINLVQYIEVGQVRLAQGKIDISNIYTITEVVTLDLLCYILNRACDNKLRTSQSKKAAGRSSLALYACAKENIYTRTCI